MRTNIQQPPLPPLSFELPYRSQRMPVLARQAVATSHPLAAQVGLSVLERGGNAIDAAIAVAAALCVVEPTMNGVGGDLFALVWDGAQLHGLNASGCSPSSWTPARFAGRVSMPALGWDAVTVPGAVSGWAALHERFATRPLPQLLAPAIRYAQEGFPVMPRMAAVWADAAHTFRVFEEFRRVFLPDGRAPRAGEWLCLPDLAETLRAIADSNGHTFYRGELARRIAEAARTAGAALNEDDLASHEAHWVAPIAIDFHGTRIHELPPNGQGLAAVLALGILRHLPLHTLDPDSPDAVHWQVEAMKLAFRDCHAHVADPRRMRITIEALLDDARLEQLARSLHLERAAEPAAMPQRDHGTVYATTADRQGRMVSLIQSNYLGFGSGVVVPNTGIALHNRGLGFSLAPNHPNLVAGGVRPYHTIMPGFATRDGQPLMSFGVMGGHMQPQGHVQLVLRTLLYRQNPQAACDAPRWYLDEHSALALEPEFAPELSASLVARGHRVLTPAPRSLFGGAQMIYKLADGYCAASDPRKDGQAVGS
jgi:gamma-glutamyltranspeptidase / glutathione hydrolase